MSKRLFRCALCLLCLVLAGAVELHAGPNGMIQPDAIVATRR